MAANRTTEGEVSVTTEIADGRTVVSVSGTESAAVVVQSASGERVYLPPEQASADIDEDPSGGQSDSPYDGTSADSPYDGAGGDSPYEGVPDDSPYGSARAPENSLGVNPTADGFRVVHPEPATDVRFLR